MGATKLCCLGRPKSACSSGGGGKGGLWLPGLGMLRERVWRPMWCWSGISWTFECVIVNGEGGAATIKQGISQIDKFIGDLLTRHAHAITIIILGVLLLKWMNHLLIGVQMHSDLLAWWHWKSAVSRTTVRSVAVLTSGMSHGIVRRIVWWHLRWNDDWWSSIFSSSRLTQRSGVADDFGASACTDGSHLRGSWGFRSWRWDRGINWLDWNLARDAFSLLFRAEVQSMTNVIQLRVVDWLTNVLNRLFRVWWRNDFVLTRRYFVGSEDADLTTCNLLLVDHYCLRNVIHLRLHLSQVVGLQV